MGLFDFLKRSKKQAVLPKQENAREHCYVGIRQYNICGRPEPVCSH